MICPSNPFISIEPILAVPGVREALRACAPPVVAVAPIIGGEAVKGPTAKMMRELGLKVSVETVAERYGDLLDGFVVDRRDAALVARLPIPTVTTNALMVSLADREQLAKTVLSLADDVLQGRGHSQAAVTPGTRTDARLAARQKNRVVPFPALLMEALNGERSASVASRHLGRYSG